MVKEEIKRKIGKYFEMKKNKDTTYENIWDSAKAVHTGKFIAINIYIKIEGRSQNNKNLLS